MGFHHPPVVKKKPRTLLGYLSGQSETQLTCLVLCRRWVEIAINQPYIKVLLTGPKAGHHPMRWRVATIIRKTYSKVHDAQVHYPYANLNHWDLEKDGIPTAPAAVPPQSMGCAAACGTQAPTTDCILHTVTTFTPTCGHDVQVLKRPQICPLSCITCELL